ncbi:hypothetical protein [Amycolatopsis methanolica]|uniref:hypothetical protein n=1 Tax=Amycolatopsis methanolica TaxID=1814 RepID=UPI003434A6FE
MLPTEGDLWEERLVRPLDVYPEHRDVDDHEGGVQRSDGFHLVSHFVEIETDDGLVGRGGPVPEQVAYVIARDRRRLLLDADPVAGEKLWDRIHRSQVHGRAGNTMLAISAVDCALCDLRGKWLGQPVYRLLGGPTRESVPAYASMLGFSVTDPALVSARAKELKELGHGRRSGSSGSARPAGTKGCAATSNWCARCARRSARTTTSCSTAGRRWTSPT